MEQNRCPGCMEIKNGGVVCEHCGYDERKKNEPHQLQIGTVLLLGKYLVGRALGQGGFGITYLGWNRYLDTKVAIKEYYPSAFVERNTGYNTAVACKTTQLEEFYAENRMRFLREAKTLAKLQSVPQIVSILDFFEMNNTAYIVMEYLQGCDLRSYVRKRGGKLTPTETFNIMRPVMAALVKVHEAGLVHRDISPDNIMLQHDGSVKLMDFGAVRNVNNPGVDKELTQATQAIVKHGFAPIEQYSERGSIGPWTDEYALCATMYYCMTGRVPENVHDRIIEGSDLNWDGIAGLTEKQKQILCKGTAIHAKDRHSNIRQLMDALFTQPAQTPKRPEAPKPAVSKPQSSKPAVSKPQSPKPAASKETEPKEDGTEQIKAEKTGKTRRKILLILVVINILLLILLVFINMPNNKILDNWVEKASTWYESQMETEMIGWCEIDGSKYYYDQNGEKVTGWQEIENSKYYFGNDGKMAIDWQEINGSKYYFGSDGKLQTDWRKIDGNKYYFDVDGKMVIGWKSFGGNKFYFDQKGIMATGSQKIDGDHYYFGGDGEMLTGWQKIDGDKYYFNQQGVGLSGWQEIDGRKYYFSSTGNGKMATKWRTIDGKKYYFDQSGQLLLGWNEIDGYWYYFDKNGRMMMSRRERDGEEYYIDQGDRIITGWLEVDEDKYYFDRNGKMAIGRIAIGFTQYYFDSQGRLVG